MIFTSEYNLRRIIREVVSAAKDEEKGPSETWMIDPVATQILREMSDEDWRGVVRILVRHIVRLDERIDQLARAADDS